MSAIGTAMATKLKMTAGSGFGFTPNQRTDVDLISQVI